MALQLPADGHDMDSSSADLPTFSDAMPPSSAALPQVPFFSLTTNTWVASSAEFA